MPQSGSSGTAAVRSVPLPHRFAPVRFWPRGWPAWPRSWYPLYQPLPEYRSTGGYGCVVRGQVQNGRFAQAPFGANAIAIAHDQHAHPKLRVNRRPPNRAIEIGEMVAQVAQIETPINAAYSPAGRCVDFAPSPGGELLIRYVGQKESVKELHTCVRLAPTLIKPRSQTANMQLQPVIVGI